MESRTIGIILVVILILLIIGWGVWLGISARRRTGFFRDYVPTRAPGLEQIGKVVPLDPETAIKKQTMIEEARGRLRLLEQRRAMGLM